MCIAQFENSVTLGSPMTNRVGEAERSAATALEPREAGFLILALEQHRDVQPQAVPDLIRQIACGPQNQLQSAQGIDGNALAHKLGGLSDSVLLAAIAGARRALSLPPSFLLGAGGQFEGQALQAAGMAPVSEDPAWGIVVVNLAYTWILELPVRHDPSQIKINSNHDLADVGRGLRDYAEFSRTGRTEANDAIGYKMACYLLKSYGHPYLRLDVDQNRGVTVSEISVQSLRRDLTDGSLQPITLVGVNAPFV